MRAKLTHSRILKVVLEPDSGANIGVVTVDAMKVSAEMGVNVEFTFNEKIYRVNFNDLMACCKSVNG